MQKDFNNKHWAQFYGGAEVDHALHAEQTKKRRQEFSDRFESEVNKDVRYKFLALAEGKRGKVIITSMTNTMEGDEGADIDGQYEFYTPSFDPKFTKLGSFEKYREKVSFIKKACIEILVSNNEVTWEQIENDILARNFFDPERYTLTEFIDELYRIRFKGYRSEFIFNDLRRFVTFNTRRADGFELDDFATLMLGMTVTNNSVKFEGPFKKDLNMVSDEYGADLFLTVRFNAIPQRDHEVIKTAYKHFVYKGVKFAGRHYDFLACSASQFREGQCFYFARNAVSVDRPAPPDLDATKVRERLGDYRGVRSVAEYSTRLGQAFSSAIPTIRIPSGSVEVIADIKRGDKNWTDGNGEVLAYSARQIAEKLNLKNPIPSCFQIRYGSAKGIIVNYSNSQALKPAPAPNQKLMTLRRSMVKYDIKNPSKYQETVYVIKHSRSRNASLCAQYILVFNALGVPIETFMFMLGESVKGGKQRPKHKSDKHTNQTLITEESAFKIFDPCARYLFGVIDKDGFLNEGEIFIKLTNKGVVTGRVAVTKSPCMHPGDIRIEKAVDIPQLHGLLDVVVFPSKGSRPTADKIANSDLDGDEFFVSWNPRLTNITPRDPAPTMVKGAEIMITSKNEMIHGVYDYFISNLYPKIISDISNYREIVRIPSKFYIEVFPHFLPHLRGQKRHSTGILGKIYDEFKNLTTRHGRNDRFDSRNDRFEKTKEAM